MHLNNPDKRQFLSVSVSVYMCGQWKRVSQRMECFSMMALNFSDCADPWPVFLKCCRKHDKCAFWAINYCRSSVERFPVWPFILVAFMKGNVFKFNYLFFKKEKNVWVFLFVCLFCPYNKSQWAPKWCLSSSSATCQHDPVMMNLAVQQLLTREPMTFQDHI